ncbi:Oxidoreductase [Geranomyces variabilis]|uniref:Mitochondrial intermembrane space import and assembly protein 40 n=1 Tax=Geranomyces variabilis TaxID=109894 RepID=A0AAD5TGC3_9FUNG|nr:Oxidoreductase [Geranomyces variabilis]
MPGVSTIPPQPDWGVSDKAAAAAAADDADDNHTDNDDSSSSSSSSFPADAAAPHPGGLDAEDAAEEAYNEETGEINWDCPCLENMTKEPCGEKFKAAFSCFVYSKEEPKGSDCIDQFREMQKCFREHPEQYAAELGDDEDEEDDEDDDEEDEKDEKKKDVHDDDQKDDKKDGDKA